MKSKISLKKYPFFKFFISKENHGISLNFNSSSFYFIVWGHMNNPDAQVPQHKLYCGTCAPGMYRGSYIHMQDTQFLQSNLNILKTQLSYEKVEKEKRIWTLTWIIFSQNCPLQNTLAQKKILLKVWNSTF